MKKDKARRGDETYTINIKSRYKNVSEFGARQTKKVCRQRCGVNEEFVREHS